MKKRIRERDKDEESLYEWIEIYMFFRMFEVSVFIIGFIFRIMLLKDFDIYL